MSLEEQEKMVEQSLLVSCDCGYRDVRQGVKAHQKTCGVRIVPAQHRAIEDQEQDAAESGKMCLTSSYIQVHAYLLILHAMFFISCRQNYSILAAVPAVQPRVPYSIPMVLI
jgi:hypothetical protein